MLRPRKAYALGKQASIEWTAGLGPNCSRIAPHGHIVAIRSDSDNRGEIASLAAPKLVGGLKNDRLEVAWRVRIVPRSAAGVYEGSISYLDRVKTAAGCSPVTTDPIKRH
jgi:hypothetical protein